jgi:hypothetical protein
MSPHEPLLFHPLCHPWDVESHSSVFAYPTALNELSVISIPEAIQWEYGGLDVDVLT